jgi:hypothetical protein
MTDIAKKLPPLGKRVLCWFDERKEWHIDELRQHGPSDGNRFDFYNNYVHNYTHWMELPDAPGNAQQQVQKE